MKNWIMLAMAVVVLLSGCAGHRDSSPEQREAIRQSNENYRRMQTP
jgi:protein involved in sex pheromone biosynthesis